jgi:hypothetical protein
MKQFALLLVCSSALIISAFEIHPEKEVTLEYKFTIGEQYALIQTSKYTVKQDIMGIEQITENALSGSVMFKVVNITPTGAKLEAQYTSLTMLMKLPAVPAFKFDSDGPQDKTENKVMKSMLNKPFYLTLSKQGVVDNIEGEENLWSGFDELGLDQNQMANMKKMFEQNFGKTSIKSSFEMGLPNYPEKKIKIGDQWKNKSGVGVNYPIQSENTWQMISFNNEVVNLEASGVVTTINRDQVIDIPMYNLKSKIDLNGTQKINSDINIKVGWPNNVKIFSTVKGNMTLLGDGLMPTDLEVPVEIIVESTYKVIKK